MKYFLIYTLKFLAAAILILLFLSEFLVKIIYLAALLGWDFKPKQTHILREFYLSIPFLTQIIQYGFK